MALSAEPAACKAIFSNVVLRSTTQTAGIKIPRKREKERERIIGLTAMSSFSYLLTFFLVCVHVLSASCGHEMDV